MATTAGPVVNPHHHAAPLRSSQSFVLGQDARLDRRRQILPVACEIGVVATQIRLTLIEGGNLGVELAFA